MRPDICARVSLGRYDTYSAAAFNVSWQRFRWLPRSASALLSEFRQSSGSLSARTAASQKNSRTFVQVLDFCGTACAMECLALWETLIRKFQHVARRGLVSPVACCDSTPGLIFASICKDQEEAAVSISPPVHTAGDYYLVAFS